MEKTRIIILAAGKGTRMQSTQPKALAPLKGKHMIKHLLQSVDEAEIDPKPIIVVGHDMDLVMKELGENYQYVIQEQQLGTGHAVYAAKDACKDAENIIVISADQPFIKTGTIKSLLEKHLSSGAPITITTTELPDFSDWRKAFMSFGRIVRENGKVSSREYKEATEEEKDIKEVNTSCYAFKALWFWENFPKTEKFRKDHREYYLTDMWAIAGEMGEKIETIKILPEEALGANSKEELEILEKFA